MSGRLIDAWKYAWMDVWLKLEEEPESPRDLFMQLYPELAKALAEPPDRYQLDTVSNDRGLARQAFERAAEESGFKNDRALVRFYEESFFLLEELGIPSISQAYACLVEEYLRRYNLRFRLIQPFQLVPHVSGVFSALFGELKARCQSDNHLGGIMCDFERSLENLGRSQHEHDLKACIMRACNQAEAIAKAFPGMKGQTLGELCKEAHVWPHKTVQAALSSLYGFCSDYPGIRHSGNPKGKLREVELRDSILLALVLIIFAGYFTEDLDFEEIVGSRAS